MWSFYFNHNTWLHFAHSARPSQASLIFALLGALRHVRQGQQKPGRGIGPGHQGDHRMLLKLERFHLRFRLKSCDSIIDLYHLYTTYIQLFSWLVVLKPFEGTFCKVLFNVVDHPKVQKKTISASAARASWATSAQTPKDTKNICKTFKSSKNLEIHRKLSDFDVFFFFFLLYLFLTRNTHWKDLNLVETIF